MFIIHNFPSISENKYEYVERILTLKRTITIISVLIGRVCGRRDILETYTVLQQQVCVRSHRSEGKPWLTWELLFSIPQY